MAMYPLLETGNVMMKAKDLVKQFVIYLKTSKIRQKKL